MTLEEYIRKDAPTTGAREFMFDAWVDEGGKVHIQFIEWDEIGPEFVVNGNTVELLAIAESQQAR